MDTRAGRTDEALVTRYVNGENEAFNELLNRYKERLYAYIYYILRNPEQSEDIFQETFMKVIVTIRQGRYNESGKFSAWLRRIAHNLIVDFYRQERDTVSCDEPEVNILNNICFAEGSVENTIIGRQILDDVHLMMNSLPDEQREVVWMRFYQGLNFKEIAELTGVSINTSLGRMRYAMLNLRRMALKDGRVLPS